MGQKKTNFVEGLIIFGVMTALLLPVRLFFVTYVSDNWLGSFGLISLVSITILILVKKRKLGKFGEMFERQLEKYQHGKRAKILYGQAILLLVILGGTIFAIEAGNSTYLEIKEELVSEYEEISDPQELVKQSENLTIQDWAFGFIGILLAVFYAFPQLSAVMAALNDTFDGWILHFYTVGFVEYLELFGILVLYRIMSRNRQKTISRNLS